MMSSCIKYTELCNKSFPPRLCRGKKLKTLRNPWLSKGLKKSIITKSRLNKLLLRKSSREHEVKYKAYKNRLTTLIRPAKKNYYYDKRYKSKSDLKQTWKILNEVLNRRIASEFAFILLLKRCCPCNCVSFFNLQQCGLVLHLLL